MRLTDFTDYTLRALMYLAIRDDRLATIEEIADAYQISKHHTSKIIQRLSSVGWIETVRGRHGGVRLAQHTRSLTVGAIVRETEHDFVLASCQASDGREPCSIVQHCRLKDILYAAKEAFLADLDRCTLAELATPTEPLAQEFGVFWFGVVAPLSHDTDRQRKTGQ
ncbi:HTH-type transcriptional repressor NsrR [Paraburkholderia nemoris]|uniref:Rrf2 family transcriptional regulator n=1 Tax=Paraburkholderia nemoris TaxID=2793076 RepID=UPI00190BC28E|nr:Rrf2 family transcriptional regulator [Paraburkholderia nemoris]MBK3739398.1 Rrf2 family transcriptional regulator [Paraburkholderia aspalathi]CAE6712080.1 HTH-type transcriptional repressor NsrR [Paraburkholderia nemoris]